MRVSSISNAAALAAALLVAGCGGVEGASLSFSGSSGWRRAQLALDDHQAPSGFMQPRNTSQSNAVSLMEVGKPIRIVRSGDIGGAGGHETHETHDKCGSTHKVHSASDKWEVCPKSCPFYAQDRTDDDFCTFACVAEPDCAKMYPKTPIGDEKLGVCRSCVVDGCAECDYSVTEDKCSVCQAAYYLKDDGLCYFKFGGAWVTYAGYVILAILVLVAIWLLDMICRPVYNEEGLKHGLEFREACKLRQNKDADGERKLWPLTTNLCKEQVAGPGMMLHFSFQAYVIIWALFVAFVWMGFAQFVDEALWILGTRAFGTPRMNCILVAWGYETQQRLMWTKVLFLWIVWVGSFLMCMAFGIYQLRAFQDADYQNKTMKDYVVMLTGLPALSGDQNVEEDLKAAIETATGQTCVGVCAAWNYQEHEKQITEALHHDLMLKERAHTGEHEPPKPEVNPVREAFFGVEASIFGIGEEEEEEEGENPAMQTLLNNLTTSTRAFAVFETEDARDKAVNVGTLSFGGADNITIEAILAEPGVVQWQNFGHDSVQEQASKLTMGFGFIGLACAFWAIVFYAPYAYYVLTFNYENGRQPGFAVGMTFSMIVVVGNAIMYEVCAQISDWVGFRFRDHREACYMLLYTIACMFNVALDFVTTYLTAEKVMEGLGFRTYFGVPLEDVPTFTAKFETYGMQRSLAENTFTYAFPSSYLIPFLIEPIPAVYGPLILGYLITKGHVKVQGIAAEEFLAMVPMDMGRYADLLLNMILGILIFYFPGGYTWQLFLGMAGSHTYIYFFDHCRILRAIPACMYASFDIEWFAQAMMAPILGVVFACLVFKSNCEENYPHCITGAPLILSCCLGWLVATVFHLLALIYVVPMFGKDPPAVDPLADQTYEQLCSVTPCSWFTSNPVHCLRSMHHYKHSPPCSYYVLGKEAYISANTKIGCYYEEGPPSPKA